MAVSATGDGIFETILRARDEATQVVKNFAEQTKQALTGTGKTAEDAGKKVQEAEKETSGSFGLIAKGAAGAAVAAAAFGVALVKSGVDAADAAGKAAERIGITVEKLTALQYAAQLADVDASKLNESLLIFNRNLDQAADTGKGRAAKAIEELGLSAEALKKVGVDEALLRIADAMAKLPDPADAGRISIDLFGRSNAAMANVLSGGREQVVGMMREAGELGAVITTGTAKAADGFNNSLTKMQVNLGGIRTQVTNEIAPSFSQLVGIFQETVTRSGAVDGAAKILTVTLKTLAFGVNLVGDAFGIAGRLLGGSAAIIGAVLKGEFREAFRIGKELTSGIDDTLKRSQQIYRQILDLDSQVQQQEKKAATRPGFKKSGYDQGGDQFGGGFIKTAYGGGSGGFTYSDVLPGAELITAQSKDAEEALSQHQQTVEQMSRAHYITLQQYDTSARAIRFQTGVKYDKLSLDASAFFFGQLGALMQTKSRALFEVGKAGAIAETIIQTYRAAQGAYAALASIPYVGPALGAAAAAAAIAVGFARVQAIRSTSFGGASGSPVLTSGGASGPVVSSGTPVAVPAQPYATQTLATPQQQVNITLQGSAFSANTIRDELIPLLNDALGDGVKLNVSTA
ncbi:MAG: hypothetical protein GC151_13945 [Betaproteobacteria bacterium]|nr:hypothetical protein [Betaproteobacteria bacterium]